MEQERTKVFSTDDYGYDYMQSLIEDCDDDDCMTEDDAYRIASEDCYFMWESIKERLTNVIGKEQRILIQGSLGLWNGRHEIYPVQTNDIETALNKTINSDINDFELYIQNEELCIDCYHHDGVNRFYFRNATNLNPNKCEKIGKKVATIFGGE